MKKHTPAAPIIAVAVLAVLVLWAFLIFGDHGWSKNLTDDERVNMVREKAAKAESMVRVTSPQINTVVRDPLTVTGQAEESWFSAGGTFRVELHNQWGSIIAVADAKTAGEESGDFIPFTVNLNFALPPTGTVGKLVFKKSNPSADPEDDLEYAYPISF